MKRWLRVGAILALVMSTLLYPIASSAPEPVDVGDVTPTPEIEQASANSDPDPSGAEWEGILFPSGGTANHDFFRSRRYAESLPSPDPTEEDDDEERSGGVGGGGETGDLEFLSVDGSRVFPLAPGTFEFSQGFGCVPKNDGYASLSSCPPERPSFHNGIDMAVDDGTVIYAAASGTVTFANVDQNNSSGNSVIRIDHTGQNEGYRSEYLHWRRAYVAEGDEVIAGQPIAEAGSIGYSTGPHLHFAVWDKTQGIVLDPMIWLRASDQPVSAEVANHDGVVDSVLQWQSLIEAAAERYEIPPALIASIMTVESGGDPGAVSPSGARGLMQVMPTHLERFGIPEESWNDPEQSIEAGSKLLAELVSARGTLNLAVAGYFGNGCDVLGTCTAEYVMKVFSWYGYYVSLFAGDPIDPGIIAANPNPDPQPSPTPEPEPTATPEPEPSPTPTPQDDENQPAEENDEESPSEEPTPVPDDEQDEEQTGNEGNETPTPSPSPSPEPTPAASPTPEPEPTQVPSPTPEPDPTPSPSPTPQPSPTPSPEPTPSPSPTPAPDPTPSPTPEPTPEPEPTPSPSPTPAPESPVPPEDGELIEGHEVLWMLDPDQFLLWRFDPETNEVVAAIETGYATYGIAFSENAVWLTHPASNLVSRVDIESNEVVEVIEVGQEPMAIAVNPEGIWVANRAQQTLSLIDPEENVVVETTSVDGVPCILEVVDGTVLVRNCDSEPLLELVPEL